MTNMIRSIRSTLSFFLAILELFISIILAIKVFQKDVASDDGLVGYVLEIFGIVDGGFSWFAREIEFGGSISFLVVVLVFMIFGQALIMAIPIMMERDRQNTVVIRRQQYFRYRRKRFVKNRFFKNQNRYY